MIKNIFFDLDHTLWDFDKNSDLTFFKILNKNNISIDITNFLNFYHPINKKYWDMYRINKVSKADLRYNRLSETFKKLNYKINDEVINRLKWISLIIRFILKNLGQSIGSLSGRQTDRNL